MAAGQGFKTFTTGEVLTAGDVNGYLMQGIWVFASATARDAAVTSPQEGNSCYLKDTDAVQTYSGSAWVAVGGSTSTNFALINAGGTALTGAATITVNVSGKNQLYVRVDSASSANLASSFSIRLNADSGSNYVYSSIYALDASAPTINTLNSTGATSCVFGVMGNDQTSTVSGHVLISGTNAAGAKPIELNSVSLLDNTSNRSYSLTGAYLGSSAITSVSIISSSGNFDAGTIYVYGA